MPTNSMPAVWMPPVRVVFPSASVKHPEHPEHAFLVAFRHEGFILLLAVGEPCVCIQKHLYLQVHQHEL